MRTSSKHLQPHRRPPDQCLHSRMLNGLGLSHTTRLSTFFRQPAQFALLRYMHSCSVSRRTFRSLQSCYTSACHAPTLSFAIGHPWLYSDPQGAVRKSSSTSRQPCRHFGLLSTGEQQQQQQQEHQRSWWWSGTVMVHCCHSRSISAAYQVRSWQCCCPASCLCLRTVGARVRSARVSMRNLVL